MTSSPPVREEQQTCMALVSARTGQSVERPIDGAWWTGVPCGEPIALVEGKWEHVETAECATCRHDEDSHGVGLSRQFCEECVETQDDEFVYPTAAYHPHQPPVITLAHPAQGED